MVEAEDVLSTSINVQWKNHVCLSKIISFPSLDTLIRNKIIGKKMSKKEVQIWIFTMI